MSINKWIKQANQYVLVPLWLLSAAAVAQDRFAFVLGVQENWDSNFARNPDVDSEHYTLAAASISAKQDFSKQQLALNLRGNQYKYDQRDDLDTDFYEGSASWRSNWNTRVKTELTWNRDAYPVDQLEFSGNDVVASDLAKAKLTIGTGKRMSFGAGVNQLIQSHSNSLRQSLELDQDEAFVEATYQTSNESSLSARVRDGKRVYPYPDPNEPRSLDYDYQQRELEGAWAPSAKTHIGALVGQFERKGQVNEGVGTTSRIDAGWTMSEKLELLLVYSHSEPAVGETSDSPSDVRGGELTLVWEPNAKWIVSTGVRYTEQEYLERAEEPARDETITAITPLSLTYRFSELMTLRINSQWVDRHSPLSYREYDYALASCGLGLNF